MQLVLLPSVQRTRKRGNSHRHAEEKNGAKSVMEGHQAEGIQTAFLRCFCRPLFCTRGVSGKKGDFESVSRVFEFRGLKRDSKARLCKPDHATFGVLSVGLHLVTGHGRSFVSLDL